jgi:protein-arginine kinase activator protein McsA
MKISEENKRKLADIKEKKLEAVKEQNFEKASGYRDQEVDFLEELLGIDIRGKAYSIRGNEIIFE